MDLSVIIVSYNVSGFLKQCLLSVKKASGKIDCEIFVVDNHSTDNSCAMIKEEFPEIKLIQNRTNPGFSTASNQALISATGRYVLLLNPDTLLNEDTFLKCIRFMDTHPEAGALGVRMINGDGKFLPESKRALPSIKSAFFKLFGFSYLFPGSKLFNSYYILPEGSSEPAVTEVISGAFMFLRRETLGKTGFLDEEYFMYGEDIDLSYNILQAGYKNYYLPDVEIIHFKGKSTSRSGYADIFHFYNAMKIYTGKRSSEGKFRYCSSLLISGIYFRMGLAILARFIKIKFTSNLQ